MTDLKFPVVYTYMPIIENNEIVSYICAKCFLIEEVNKYLANGEIITKNKVFFIYNQDKKLNNINIVNNECKNYTLVDKVFRTVESCQRYVRLKNEKLFINKFKNQDSVEKMNQLFNNKENIINEYKSLEYQLLNDNYNNIVDISMYKKRRKI